MGIFDLFKKKQRKQQEVTSWVGDCGLIDDTYNSSAQNCCETEVCDSADNGDCGDCSACGSCDSGSND